jgi:26S proteasome non-ATPase regulatory subunit 9
MSRDDDPTKAVATEEDETSLRKQLTTLDVEKKTIESEADAILHELTNPPSEGIEPMGLDTPLVDGDGYPRGDIDVYRARSQRNRFRILQTDHKEIKVKIEDLLDELAKKKVRTNHLE